MGRKQETLSLSKRVLKYSMQAEVWLNSASKLHLRNLD